MYLVVSTLLPHDLPLRPCIGSLWALKQHEMGEKTKRRGGLSLEGRKGRPQLFGRHLLPLTLSTKWESNRKQSFWPGNKANKQTNKNMCRVWFVERKDFPFSFSVASNKPLSYHSLLLPPLVSPWEAPLQRTRKDFETST